MLPIWSRFSIHSGAKEGEISICATIWILLEPAGRKQGASLIFVSFLSKILQSILNKTKWRQKVTILMLICSHFPLTRE